MKKLINLFIIVLLLAITLIMDTLFFVLKKVKNILFFPGG